MITQNASLSRSRRSFASIFGMPAGILLCTAWIAMILIVAIFAHWLAPFDYTQQSPLTRFAPPFKLPDHLLGTDFLGRDLLSNLLAATQTTLMVAMIGGTISAIFGTSLGFLSAHYGGWIDNLVMGIADAMASVPFMIIALGVLAVFGSSPLLFVLLMGVFNWWRYARLARGLVLSANADGYAEAARIVGVPPLRIYLRHILPNIAGPLVVQFTLNFPEIVLMESGLSFLGVGIKPPAISLGLMISYGTSYFAIAWWLVALPGLVLVLTTLSISLLGDYLRDRLDARLR